MSQQDGGRSHCDVHCVRHMPKKPARCVYAQYSGALTSYANMPAVFCTTFSDDAVLTVLASWIAVPQSLVPQLLQAR